jgi:hypothetical protein
LEAGSESDWKKFNEARGYGFGEKYAALMEAAPFCASLGRACHLMAGGVEDIGGYGLEEACGVILIGLGCGEVTRSTTFFNRLSDRLMNFFVRGESSCSG